jgi:hypothetical protein
VFALNVAVGRVGTLTAPIADVHQVLRTALADDHVEANRTAGRAVVENGQVLFERAPRTLVDTLTLALGARVVVCIGGVRRFRSVCHGIHRDSRLYHYLVVIYA